MSQCQQNRKTEKDVNTISDINILLGHVGFKHSPMDKKSQRSSACRSEEKNLFFSFFSIPLFKESTKCTGTASVQELQGAPGAKSATDIFMKVKVIIFQLN